jgi:hypothetical protein
VNRQTEMANPTKYRYSLQACCVVPTRASGIIVSQIKTLVGAHNTLQRAGFLKIHQYQIIYIAPVSDTAKFCLCTPSRVRL